MAGATVGPGAGAEYQGGVNQTNRPFVAGGAASNGAMTDRWTMGGSIHGPLSEQETRALAERRLASVADPTPLGLAGFAAATFTASTVLAGWFDGRDLIVAIPVLLVFGGIAQFLAGMWSYARANLLGTVAFCSFGSFNVAFALLLWMQATHAINPINAPGSDQAKVAGVFVLMFALISAYLAYAALSDNLLIAGILGVLALAYLCDGVGLWIGGQNWLGGIGGYAGIVASLLAFYGSAAIVVNALRGREALHTYQVRR